MPEANDDEADARLHAHSARVEQLLDEIEGAAAPETWSRVAELVQRLSEMYGAGLERTLAQLGDCGAAGERALGRLCDDPLVASLLVLADLPAEPTSLRAALAEQAAPASESGLVQIGRKRAPKTAAPSEAPRKREHAHEAATHCELCAAPVMEAHAHVVDLEQRSLMCACKPCSLLFERAEGGRYRTVPRRVLVEPDNGITPARFATLGVPVQLAFVFRNSALEQWTALYPSPAGPTEAALLDDDVERFANESALLRAVTPDVEALLVYGRRGSALLESFLAPIDDCYHLVARVRRSWRGFDGGDEARRDIEDFFAGLRARARPLFQQGREAS